MEGGGRRGARRCREGRLGGYERGRTERRLTGVIKRATALTRNAANHNTPGGTERYAASIDHTNLISVTQVALCSCLTQNGLQMALFAAPLGPRGNALPASSNRMMLASSHAHMLAPHHSAGVHARLCVCVCVCVCVCLFWLSLSTRAGSEDVETSCWAPEGGEETIKRDFQL